MADEQKIKDEKDLDMLLAKQQEIQEEVANAIREGKEKVNIDFGGRVIINIKLLNSIDEKENYEFNSDDDLITGKVTRNKKDIDVDVDFDKKRIHARMDQERYKNRRIEEDIKDHTVDSNNQEALKKEIETGLKNGNAHEMEIDREFSESENMRMFVRRAWGITADNIYRVKGKDPHDFKYVAKTTSGKYQEIPLSTQSEGTNSRQNIFVMENGKLKEKEVDSLLLRGRYGIATDLAENVASQNTRTYLVSRTPSGEYIAIAAGQKSGVNRNTSGDELQKKYMGRGRSVYELEDTIEAAKLAEQIYALNKDGKLTTREVEMVKKFKIDKNMDNKEVFEAVTLVAELKDMGYECNEIKTILSARDKEEIIKLAKEVDEHSKETNTSNTEKRNKIDEDIDEDIDAEGKSIYDNPHTHEHKH